MVTNDGRNIVVRAGRDVAGRGRSMGTGAVLTAARAQGTLKGYDHLTNVILEDSYELVFSTAHPVKQEPLGLYIVRGDNLYGARGGRVARSAAWQRA